MCFAQRQKFDKQDQSFYCFFLCLFLQLEYFIAQELLLKGEKKWLMRFFFCLQLKSFYGSRVSFERRKESG